MLFFFLCTVATYMYTQTINKPQLTKKIKKKKKKERLLRIPPLLHYHRTSNYYRRVMLQLTINHAGDGPFIVHVGEEDELLVDEVRVGDEVCALTIQE